MEQLVERCAGLDVHQAEITACARVPGERGEVVEIVQEFGTTTPDLLAMLDWLVALGVTEVAMESTGVFWKSPYYVMEGHFDRVLVVNAAHIKHVPGRKTDVIDAAWIAQLLAHGLLRGSFVPLEDAGVKLAVVASDVMGVSGRAMMRALIEGQADPDALADLAKGRLRTKLPELRKALTSRFRGHHAFLLERMLAHVVDLECDIGAVQERIEEAVAPFARQIEVLDSIPGVGTLAAQAILAEIGTDMSVFPTAEHCASWAAMCPGQNESAGKRKSGKTRKGSRWLRTILLESAHAAGKSKGTYLSERYRQLARRRGKKKALVAIGHDILVTAYHLLATDQHYQDSGPERVKTEAEDLAKRRAIRQLQSLGYRVALTPLPGSAA
jgi:transposase